MNKYLPSKKFIKFFGTILLLIGVFWGGSFLFSRNETYKNEKADEILVVNSENSPYVLDTDKDGIYDWEEGLWGTNPKKSDTNGDGISDGEEIRILKNEIKEKNNTELDTEEVETEGLNQTEVFARQFFATASLVNQRGGLTPESVKSFSDSFGKSITDTKIPDPFSLVDIKLSSVSPAEYKKSLDNAFSSLVSAQIDDLATIYNFSFDNGASEDKMNTLIMEYQKLSNNLLAISVPHNISGTHLSLVNNFAKMSIALINIKKISNDPLISLVGLRQYNEYSELLEKNIVNLAEYFSQNGIIY